MSKQIIFLLNCNFHIPFHNHAFPIFILFFFHFRLVEEVYVYVRTKFAQRHLRQVVLTQHFSNYSSSQLITIHFHMFFPIFFKVISLFYFFQVFQNSWRTLCLLVDTLLMEGIVRVLMSGTDQTITPTLNAGDHNFFYSSITFLF